jgi:hypothetical protein
LAIFFLALAFRSFLAFSDGVEELDLVLLESTELIGCSCRVKTELCRRERRGEET